MVRAIACDTEPLPVPVIKAEQEVNYKSAEEIILKVHYKTTSILPFHMAISM